MDLLIVDDEQHAREALRDFLGDRFTITLASDGAEALKELEKKHFHLVITDHQMPNVTGIELIKKSKELYPDIFFIMLTAHGSLDHAIDALRSGADDYIVKPVDFDELEHRVSRIEELLSYRLKKIVIREHSDALEKIIGESQKIKELKGFIEQVADVEQSVLINGPTGSGKELIAQTIHKSSPRKDFPFIAINCATLGANLLESELFGHEKGAFTGADQQKIGKFELAQQGTLFLDEIGELPVELQAKLLRVLQEKEFYRLGGNRIIKSQCRILTATHKNLPELIKEGLFREDLYFRLNVLQFEIPSLAERAKDIPLITSYFWQKLQTEFKTEITLEAGFLKKLSAYDFPGNIRELKNILERVMVLNRKKTNLGEAALDFLSPSQGQSETTSDALDSNVWDIGLSNYLEKIEKDIVLKAMDETENNQVKAAKLLGITRGALQYKLQKYNQ